jgi:hypothetical protein
MVEHFVRNIGGIGLYGMVSLLLFFAVFVGVLVRACRWGRSDLEAAARLPLEDADEGCSSGKEEKP